MSKVIAATFLSAFLFTSQSAFSGTDAQAVGAVIAPAELMSAYACSTYAEEKFIPILKARLETVKGNKKALMTDVKKLFQSYDDVLASMCKEVEPIFVKNREQVQDTYARQLPRITTEEAAALTSPAARHWGAESSKFLATAPLIQLMTFVREAVPEFLDPKPEQMPLPLWRVTSEIHQEVRRTTVGMGAQMERMQLVHFLNDKGFAQLVPARYNLELLAKEELRLRKEAAKLNSSNLYWYNDNASDLTRMHFNAFDVMREIGLAPIYLRYEALMSQIGK